MNESLTNETYHRPSAFSAFTRGGMSGLFSGAVMAGIIAVISPLIMGGAAISVGSAALMVIASTLFGGIMATKRAVFDGPTHYNTAANDIIPVPVPLLSPPGIAPVMAFADTTPEQASPKNWVAETSRTNDSPSRIQQILADGSLTDKDRASAILASRNAADTQASRA